MWKTGSPMHDKETTTRLWVAVLFLAMLTWLGCATRGRVYDIKPAEVCFGSIRTLAVLKFDGPWGETVCSHVYNRLAEVQHFRSIDIRHIHALDNVGYGQVDDPRFLPALVAELKTDGVITGRVTASIQDARGTDQVQVKEATGHYKKEKNLFGQWVDVEIKRTVVRPVPYIVRKASLTTEYKVLDLKIKRVIATGMLTESYDGKFGGDKEYAPYGHKLSDLPALDSIADELSASIATKLVAKISRMKLAGVIKFDEGGNTMVKRGVKLAKRGAWEEARVIWQQVIHHEPNNAAAYYNLGVAHETLGDINNLKIARQMYNRAATYGDKKLYTEAMARINSVIRQSYND